MIVGIIGSLAIIGGVKQAKDRSILREKSQQSAATVERRNRADSLEKAIRDSLAQVRTDSIKALTPEQIAATERQHKADSIAQARRTERTADSTRRALAKAERAAERERLAQQRRIQSSTFNSYSSSRSTYSGGNTIYTGPRGGRYYINSSGKKTYIKR